MTAKSRVTSAQAHEVLATVRRRFRPYLSVMEQDYRRRHPGERYPYGPKLVRAYDPYWGGGRIPYAVLWEDGPSEWVYQLLWGEPDPELVAEGGSRRYSEPVKVPGTFLEAGTSFILCIFPDDVLN